MKTIALLVLSVVCGLPAMAQNADQIINSSINAFVPQGGASFMGFIISPAAPDSDVDVVVLAGGCDPVVTVYLDSTSNSPVAGNDDWLGSTQDLPATGATNNARNCFENFFSGRLDTFDSMVLLSITAPSGGTRAVFTEVRGFNNSGGQVNLQLLQVDGPLTGICPDF